MPERDAAAAKTPPGDGSRSTNVQQAVEMFVELHSAGEGPDPAAFAARFPADVRPRILLQCREFLAFDGLLGHQEWTPSSPKEEPGRTFGDFVIQEELGRGGMGVVYLAHQKSLNRRVALKVMASGLTLSKRHVERFRREAAAAAQLHHPAIVAVHALVEVDGTFALAMDYVAGRNLADMLDDLRLRNGESPATIEGSLGLAPEKGYVAECAMFTAELASALAVAHQANVVHRDLKPRNLMLDDHRQVRLLDFGLAKSLGEGSISMSGEITGTAHYMSPEQTLAKRVMVDHRADIWSLGVILYEMLTLRRPFDGKNLQQVVYEICFKEPPPLQRRNPKVPRDLVTICHKALEKDPQNRYQTAAEFEADLLRFLRWEPIHAKPAGAWTRLAKWTRRHRMETAIAGTLVLAGVAALGVDWVRGRQADELLAQAATASASGHHGEASELANRALALRNDQTTRALLTLYSSEERRIEAEAMNTAFASKDSIERDREQAIQLALQAEAQHSSSATRSAVLDALGRGNVYSTLRSTTEAPLPRLVAARWSPDSKVAATIGWQGHVMLWDAATATVVATLRGHAADGPIVGVAFAGNERVVTAGTDRTLRFWRRPDGTLLHTEPLPGTAAAMQATPDGSRVLVLTYGGKLVLAYDGKIGPFLAQVFDTATMQPVSPAVAHAGLFVASAISPCGRFAATCSGLNGSVRLWRVDTGLSVVPEEAPPRGRVRALCFSPDSALLAVAIDHEVRLVRVGDGAIVGCARHSLDVTSLAFDSKGQRLLTGSRDWTARLWSLQVDAGRGTVDAVEVATLIEHKGPVDHVAFDGKDQFALTATGGQAGELCVFDVAAGRSITGQPLQRLEIGPSIETAEFSPDGRAVLALAGSGRVVVWDLASARGVLTIRQAAWAGAVAFDREGRHLVSAGIDEHLQMWSVQDGNQAWTSARVDKPQTGIDVDDAGERIASCGRQSGLVHVHRLADGERICELDHGDGVNVVRFHDRGSRLLTAGKAKANGVARAAGRLIVWNTGDWSRVREIDVPHPIVAADARADGSLLATIEENESTVRLWTPGGDAGGELVGPGQRLASVRFAPDGNTLLTADRDGARIQDLTGRVLMTFGSAQPLRFATYSRDGRLVLTCSEGRNPVAVMWRAADGTELLRFTGHRGPIEWGTFSPDGGTIATTARDGSVCIWPTDPVAVARRLVPGAVPPLQPTTK